METLTPIGAREWFFCEGSQSIQEGEPDKSDRTRDNIACHWLANEILASYITPNAALKAVEEYSDTLAPNDVLIDDEMMEAAKLYITDILMYNNHAGLMRATKLDEEINLDHFCPGMKGVIDASVFNPKNAEIVIWLLKYEYGHIEVLENPELMLYAWAIMEEMGIDGISDQSLTVSFRLIQPRSFHHDGPVRTWQINGSDLRTFFNQLKFSAAVAMKGTGRCTTGTHCRYCRGTHKCKALTKTVYNAIDVVTGPMPVELKGSNLAVELKLLRRISDLLKYRLSGVETQVERNLLKGDVLPGYKLKQGYGRKRWRKDTDTGEVLMMSDIMGVDLRKPDNLDTPTQAIVKFKKLAKAQKVEYDETLIEQYFETPKTSLKVIEDDGNLAKQVFGK